VLPPADAVPASLAAVLDPVIDAAWDHFDSDAAQGHVDAIGPTWRLAGNAAFDAALDRVRSRLADSGFSERDLHVDSYPLSGPAWEYTVGTLAMVDRTGRGADDVVLSRETHQVALAINSFSTVPGGVVARLIDVGAGREEDYTGRDLSGAVVLGDASLGQLWRRAIVGGGALGVVSTTLASYITPDAPGMAPTPRDDWDILQWGSVPYDAERRAFGFKASPRAAATLRRALANEQTVQVRVTIESTFSDQPARTLIAEIPGSVAPDERVVLAAHVQEPGSGDNASGVATLAEVAHAISTSIRDGALAAPRRTMTFLWLDEISGSRQWLRDHPEQAMGTRYMLSLDMTGEDVTRTGGRFLVERWPDPGAVWTRPWDPHSEWGAGRVRADQLTGDLINDVHLAICQRVATRSGWQVFTNPYEGGSDHTVFGSAGVPSILDWHFTDRYYHTSMDTPDKTSGAEMRNVGVAVAASAWLLASADESMSLDVARLVAAAGSARIAVEEREGRRLAEAAADPASALAQEADVMAAWRHWYAQAVRSVSRLIIGEPGGPFHDELERLAAPFIR